MKSLPRILAYEGLALIAFALLSIVFAGETIVLALILLLAGLLCIAGYLVFGGVSFKEQLLSRGAKYGTNAVVYSLAVLALLVAVNYLGFRHNKEWDLTSVKIHTLSDQTTKVLGSLAQPIQVIAFLKPGEETIVKELLERYGRASDRFAFKIVDPDLNPELVQRYKITQRGEIYVASGDRNTTIQGQTEQDLTNALIKVSKEQQGAVYFLGGHGEVQLDSKQERGLFAAKLALENENYIVRSLLLESQPGVPPDCKALIIAGPTKRLPETVIQAIDRYLSDGGRALVMLDPSTNCGLEPLVEKYGITVHDDIVVDQQVRLFEGATLGIDPIVSDFPAHEITKNFQDPVVFPRTRTLELVSSNPAGALVQSLGQTGESSWAETSVAKLFETGEVAMDPDETTGPLTVAAVAQKKIENAPPPGPDEPKTDDNGKIVAEKQTRLVVCGDADFASNQYVNYLFNGPLFLNMVHWLSGEDYLVAIPPRSYAPANVMLTQRDRQLVFLVSVFLIPQIILMFGIGTILRRRGR